MERPAGVRSWAVAAVTGLTAALLVAVGVTSEPAPRLTDDDCAGGYVLSLPGQPDVCAHPDAAPSGVDVHAPVGVAALRARPGAGPAAYAAAQDLGVPGTYGTNATSRDVTCDGDGTSGARVQAMYVVEAGRTNRYLDLLPSLQLWAAGTDDVLNRSAALTGGSRHIRYVTDVSGSACVARVLNVTVPAGAAASFNTLVAAVQALGYTSASRKYLMWTDANALCGVATMYPDENPAQTNRNNGLYAQYARVDSGCWGWGNGTNQHSVEAHELVHMLGGVQYQAPHTTQRGHCWDEADAMCYSDGGTHAMVAVCPAEREYLLDCNSDDYWSTYAPAGSYLAGAWNAANNRFLVGGGDGTNGGSLGAPTSLGGSLAVNNPAVPGLPTQASVTPELPAGRTLTGVAWRAGNSTCVVAASGDGTQATVTCPVSAASTTTLTATLTDSTGASKTITSPLTFQTTGTKRAVSVALTVDGQSPSAAVCTGIAAVGRAVVVDVASGVPVKGLTVGYNRLTSTMTAPSAAGSKVSGTDGVATASLVTSVPVSYGATTTAAGMFLAGSTAARLTATPARCTASLAGATDKTTPWYGETVTVTGTVRRTVSTSDDTPVNGASVQVAVKAPDVGTTVGRTTVLATVSTNASGAFTATFRATTAGRLRAVLPTTTGLTGATVDLGDLTVRIPTTSLTAAADVTDVGYGGTVPVRGSLTKTTSATGPVSGAPLKVLLAPTAGGTPLVVGSGVTRTDGSYAVTATVKAAGRLSVVYAGVPGLPPATADAGAVTVGSWTPALTLASSSSSVVLGGYVTLTGTATRTYGTTTEVARSLRVTLVLAPSSGAAPVVLGYATTSSLGAYRVAAFPRTSGTVRAVVSGVTGYVDVSSPSVGVAVV